MDQPTLKLPTSLHTRLQQQLGEQFSEFLQALEQPAPVSVRLNPDKPIQRFQHEAKVPWCENGRYLPSRPRFTSDPLFHAGAYYVQEASSMFLDYILKQIINPEVNYRVLDLSAAPGGKATLLSALLSLDSLLVANEIIPSRNKILRHNLARWGNDNHIVTQSDPKYFSKLPALFDIILVDAPCSGEGLIRKEPGALGEWSEKNVNLCASRQKRILADVLPALADNGILIYSTCTYSEAENEENMEWLLNHADITPMVFDLQDSFGVSRSEPLKAGHRFYPHRVDGEGFFIAAFRNNRKTTSPKRNKYQPKRNFQSSLPGNEDKVWLKDVDRYIFLDRDEHRTALPRAIYDDYLKISKALRITYSGLYMGKVYHGKLKPSPELALSRYVSNEVPRLELSIESSLDYLAHANLSLPSEIKPGYHLITHAGYGLGWLHVLRTGQVRNKFPSAWRILNR